MNTAGIDSGVPALVQTGVLQTGDAAAVSRQAKLTDAAQKFEGMMLQELLKPMQEGKGGSFGGFGGGFSTGDDDADRDGSLDTMSSFGTEAVANAISKHGGLGIAKEVLRQIGSRDERAGKKS
jgi:Rod binding domain-containing protein